ncbi:uncharacterized protein METZ01_LOCUS418736, partial [marine metagenome]
NCDWSSAGHRPDSGNLALRYHDHRRFSAGFVEASSRKIFFFDGDSSYRIGDNVRTNAVAAATCTGSVEYYGSGGVGRGAECLRLYCHVLAGLSTGQYVAVCDLPSAAGGRDFGCLYL